MDPPRAGSSRPFLNALLKLRPKKIVYVSCNPETLKRDLSYLTGNGYQVKKIQPVDMFPHTDNVERVVVVDELKKEGKIAFLQDYVERKKEVAYHGEEPENA